jgi:hypothetical protein
MESHPSLDFGVPGPLVHFVERFYVDLMERARRNPAASEDAVAALTDYLEFQREVMR